MVGTWAGEGVGEEAEGQGRPGSRGHLGRQSRPGRGALAERREAERCGAAGAGPWRGPGPGAAGGRREAVVWTPVAQVGTGARPGPGSPDGQRSPAGEP